MKIQNKWIRAAIPALLLHCSIGTVYCWSIFSQEIADYIGFSKGATEWAFSFAIFFLGMSAAFLGNVVEKDIHKSSLIATICFAVGMAGTGFFIYYGGLHKGSALALIGIYVCYGFIMGIGLGTGYLSPVKTLMLWFADRKGLATGLAVAGFGAAKAIASPIMQAMLSGLGEGGIYKMFFILAAVYFVMMFVGHLLLKKPDGWHEPQKKEKGERRGRDKGGRVIWQIWIRSVTKCRKPWQKPSSPPLIGRIWTCSATSWTMSPTRSRKSWTSAATKRTTRTKNNHPCSFPCPVRVWPF